MFVVFACHKCGREVTAWVKAADKVVSLSRDAPDSYHVVCPHCGVSNIIREPLAPKD